MAKLYIVNKQGALYKTGTVLRRYDDGYVRQELKPYGKNTGRMTFSDAGFQIDHAKLNAFVIPMNGKIQFEVTSDGTFALDNPYIITDNGRILGST